MAILQCPKLSIQGGNKDEKGSKIIDLLVKFGAGLDHAMASTHHP